MATAIKTSELSGAALDWAVIVAEHGKHDADNPAHVEHFKRLRSGHLLHQQAHYSSNWAQGGPIIERERIELLSFRRGGWEAQTAPKYSCHYIDQHEGDAVQGATALIAAMRCYVASKLGDTVFVPQGLEG